MAAQQPSGLALRLSAGEGRGRHDASNPSNPSPSLYLEERVWLRGQLSLFSYHDLKCAQLAKWLPSLPEVVGSIPGTT